MRQPRTQIPRELHLYLSALQHDPGLRRQRLDVPEHRHPAVGSFASEQDVDRLGLIDADLLSQQRLQLRQGRRLDRELGGMPCIVEAAGQHHEH